MLDPCLSNCSDLPPTPIGGNACPGDLKLRAPSIIPCWNCLSWLSVFLLWLPLTAHATIFNWNKPNGCGLFSCNFFDAGHWSPAGGPPGAGDIATINMNGGVHLTQDTQSLDRLTLENSTSLRTFGNRLNVQGTPGTLFLFGSGFHGSTVLRVDDGGGFDVTAETISLHAGSELFLNEGGVLARFRLLVSRSSLISGRGTIGVTANNIGSAIQVAGTIRPHGGDINIVSSNSTIDLDGDIVGEEPGVIDLTSTGSLNVSGEQADPFSGRLDIGNRQELNVGSDWSMDGALNFTTGEFNRLVGPQFTFLTSAQVTTDQSAGQIDGESIWRGGSSVNLTQSADYLELLGDTTIHGGATFSGRGELRNAAGATLLLRDGANVGVELLNEGTLAIGGPAGVANVSEYRQAAGGTLGIDLGGTAAGEFDSLHIASSTQLAGNLDVDLLTDFTLAPAQQFKILEIDGNATGQFAGLAEGAMVGTPGEELFISYVGGDGNDVVLYTMGPPGDFNFDGRVDGFDFLHWQRGESPNPLSAADLADWKSNFGTQPSPVAAQQNAVPEPTAMTLVAAWLLPIGILSRRRTTNI